MVNKGSDEDHTNDVIDEHESDGVDNQIQDPQPNDNQGESDEEHTTNLGIQSQMKIKIDLIWISKLIWIFSSYVLLCALLMFLCALLMFLCSYVRGVRLRRDRIIVILEQKIFVYNFTDLKLLQQIETFANPKGLCEVSQASGNFVLVCLELRKGQVRVEHYASKQTKFILAHDSRMPASLCHRMGICLPQPATRELLFVSSILTTGHCCTRYVLISSTLFTIHEFLVRRGADRAEIHSLAFSPTAEWLAVSSDKVTILVFSITPLDNPDLTTSSPRALIKGVMPKYFNSVWSLAQFRLVEGSQYTVAFGHQKNTIVILGLDGSFYRCQFDPKAGGETTQLEYHNFVKPDDAL
ncbi:hypothetical protein LXL04_003653 [Taraxacum kok-saghyz]